MHPLVISGSSRTDGNTKCTIESFFGNDVPVVDLCTLNLSPYDYAYRNRHDDFLPLIYQTLSHDPLVFATPVYWYTMSAWMKIFFDRTTDLIYHHNALARHLKGKTALLLVASAGGKPTEFETPLVQTFNYLGMKYKGCWDHVYPLDKHSVHNEKEKERFTAQWPEIIASCTPQPQDQDRVPIS